MATKQGTLNMDAKVTVRSIAGWDVGFVRYMDGMGGVTVPPNGTCRVSRNEVMAQVQNGNKLFTGIDGKGSHATLYVEDEATRIEADFDDKDGSRKQDIFSDEKVKGLFEIQSQEAFEAAFKNAIMTRAEKYAVMGSIRRQNLNDYRKINFAEKYTGYKLYQE